MEAYTGRVCLGPHRPPFVSKNSMVKGCNDKKRKSMLGHLCPLARYDGQCCSLHLGNNLKSLKKATKNMRYLKKNL